MYYVVWGVSYTIYTLSTYLHAIGDVFQAEDRVRRIGQKSSIVTSIWITGYPLDEKLDKLLQLKDKSSQIVLHKQDTSTGTSVGSGVGVGEGSKVKAMIPRQWFHNTVCGSKSGSSNTTNTNKKENSTISNYFPVSSLPPASSTDTPCTVDATCVNHHSNTNTNHQAFNWNVSESEEEMTVTTNNIMAELLRSL